MRLTTLSFTAFRCHHDESSHVPSLEGPFKMGLTYPTYPKRHPKFKAKKLWNLYAKGRQNYAK
jgi:hypothetical protein